MNKSLSNNEDINKIWNINTCHHQIGKKIVSNAFDIPKGYFVDKQDMCYCCVCYKNRREKAAYYRGDPCKKYAIPKGWVRLGLNINENKAKMNKVFEKWHVSYHGTSSTNVVNIFKSGLVLLKACLLVCLE